MRVTSTGRERPTWRERIPRWLRAWLLLVIVAGVTFTVARLSRNSTIVPTGVFLASLSGPLAFAVWLTDRTRVGRSVAPDVLFATWLLGGGAAIVIAGIFESPFFFQPAGPGYLWVALVEEVAKVVVPLGAYWLVRRYRSVPQALALAIVTAAGFATFESMAYGLEALDESIRAARRVLLERSLLTPFGHLPWTAIATVVAVTAWQADGRVRVTPRALWGLAAAVALHTAWNVALAQRGWWWCLAPIAAVVTVLLFRHVLRKVRYVGPYIEPVDHTLGHSS
jgi:RsiW-degrading membrane proteinase PrsW (M82 family)